VEEVLLFKKCFPIVNTCLSCEDIARQSCAMMPRWRLFASCVSASRVHYISDLHSKFALRPHDKRSLKWAWPHHVIQLKLQGPPIISKE